jgi:hypothetical protein
MLLRWVAHITSKANILELKYDQVGKYNTHNIKILMFLKRSLLLEELYPYQKLRNSIIYW